LPQVERNEQNLITSSTDSRGHITLFTYDNNGNVIQIQDELSGGSSTIGSIGEPGEVDQFTFNATAGQRLFYDALEADFDSISVRLVSPSGSNLINQNADSDSNIFTLPETGTYQLIVDGSGATTGDYKFQLLSVENQTPLVLNTNFISLMELMNNDFILITVPVVLVHLGIFTDRIINTSMAIH
jgi:YD repeat-containing protein